MSYDIGIIDAEYILRRAWSIQKSTNSLNKNLLIKSFMQSIMKLKREFEFSRPLLLFDSAPYLKIQEVQEYKQDRYYVTQSDVDRINEALQSDDLSEEEREKLIKELEQIKQDIYEYTIRRDAKYDLVENGRNIGFITLIKKGFEADDIAFAVSEKIRELKKTAILITTDRDWVSFRSPEVDYSTPKHDHRNQFCRELVLDSRRINLPLYEIGVLREIYYSSHNNVTSYEFSNEVDFDTFCKKLTTNDNSLKGYEQIKKIYEAMNMRKHFDELSKLINFSLVDIEVDNFNVIKYLKEREININMGTFSTYLKGLNKGLL